MIHTAYPELRAEATDLRRYRDPALHTAAASYCFPELWRMLRNRCLVILAWAALLTLVAVFYVLIKDSRYEASARIEVSPRRNKFDGVG